MSVRWRWSRSRSRPPGSRSAGHHPDERPGERRGGLRWGGPARGWPRWARRRAVAIPVAVAVLAVAGVITAVAAQPAVPISVRNVRIPVVDGPANNQHVILDATFFTPA